MKSLVNLLSSQPLVLRELELLENKKLGVKRKIKLFKGIDRESYYHLFVVWEGSTRVVRKDVAFLINLHATLEDSFHHAIKKVHVWFPHAVVCSKATLELEKNLWRIYHDPL